MENPRSYLLSLFREGSLLFALLMYVLLVLRLGYEFGRNDHIEVLPYALWLNDPSLFPHDLFLQGLVNLFPNERLAIAGLLSLFGEYLEPATWMLHFLSAMVLVLGMERIARFLLGSKYPAWIAVFLTLLPFYFWNPGGNELYYNLLTAASIAKAIGVWGLYAWLKGRIHWAAGLFGLATIFHPVVGMQLAMLLLGVEGLMLFFSEEKTDNTLKAGLFGKISREKAFAWIRAVLIYGATGFLYLLSIKLAYDHAPAEISAATFFDIIFDFRNGHHFMPSRYPLKGFLLMALCWGAAYYFFRKNKRLQILLVLLLAGYLLYPVGTEVLRSSFIAPFQWYKTCIWLRFLGMTALAGLFTGILAKGRPVTPLRHESFALISSLALALMLLILFRSDLPWKAKWDFGRQEIDDPLIAVCRQARLVTPQDAVFIYPIEVSELSYYGRRSAYVDYKANLKQNAGAAEWMRRVGEVYGMDYHNKEGDRFENADHFFRQWNPKSLEALAHKGVTHILTFADHNLEGLPWLAGNEQWAIYELKVNTP